MQKTSLSIDYRWHLSVSKNGFSFANILRRIADRIDGRESIAISMWSIPAIPANERAEIIYQSLNHACRLFEEYVNLAAIESGMRELRPDLNNQEGAADER